MSSDLEIGDTIIWRGEGLRIRNDEEGMILISPGIKGKVITRSENLLAHSARKTGLPITAGPWALVEFEDGFRMVADCRAQFERSDRKGGPSKTSTGSFRLT